MEGSKPNLGDGDIFRFDLLLGGIGGDFGLGVGFLPVVKDEAEFGE